MFDLEREEVQRQWSALQQLLLARPGAPRVEAKRAMPAVLATLYRSLRDLQLQVAEASEEGLAGARVSGRSEALDRSGAPPVQPDDAPASGAPADRGPVLVRIMGTDGRCRWANRAWFEFIGRAADTSFAEHWIEDLHEGDRAAYLRTCEAAYASGRLYWVEYRVRRRTGGYGWVLEIGAPRIGFHDDVDGYLVAAIEITEQRQAVVRLELQYEIGHALAEAPDMDSAYAAILRILGEGFGWDVGESWSVDSPGGVPVCTRKWASPVYEEPEHPQARPSQRLAASAGHPWPNAGVLWIDDITVDPILSLEPGLLETGMRGMLRLNVLVNGEARGILRWFSREPRRRDPAVVDFMNAAGAQIERFLEQQHELEAVRGSEARKNAILDAALDAVITIDAENRVLDFNAAAETIFGYRRGDALGREVWGLIFPPRMRQQALASLAHFRSTGEHHRFYKQFASLARRADGSEFPVEVAMAPIGADNPSLLTMFICDATEKRRAEEQVRSYQERLRSLMADLLVAEEHERRKLATDLHDGLSQTIALTRIKLATLRSCVDPRLAQSLDDVLALVDQANTAARSIGFELSPPVLHDMGLEPAVQWLVENIHSRYGIEIVLEDDGQPKPADEKTRVILFRSIRELLINAAKHAGARKVQVRLRRDDDQLTALVEDDGIGMDANGAVNLGSGLISIHERLSHVGGSMHIESARGRGTTVQLRAPLNRVNAPKKGMKA